MTNPRSDEPAPDSTSGVFRSAVAGVLAANGRTILEVATFAALVRLLPLETHGIVLAAGAFLARFNAFDAGLLKTAEKFVSEHRNSVPSQELRRTITLLVIASAVIAAGVGLVLLTISALGLLSGLVSDNNDGIDAAARLTAGLLILVWPAQMMRHIAYGLGMHIQAYRLQLMQAAAVAITSIPAAYMGADAFTLIVLRALPVLCGGLLLARWIRSRHRQGLFCRPDEAWQQFAHIRSYAATMLAMKISTLLNFVGHNILPATLLGMGAVPVFYGLRRVVEFAIALNGTFKQIALPLASSLDREGEARRLRAYALDGTHLMTAAFAPGVVALAIFARPILELLGGEVLVGGASYLTATLLLLTPIITRAFVVHLAMGTGRHVGRLVMLLNLSSALYLGTLATFLIAGGPTLGLLAHPLAHMILFPFVMVPVAAAVGVTLRELSVRALRALAPAYIGGVLVWVPAGWISGYDASVELITGAIPTLCVLYALTYLFGLDRNLRLSLASHIAKYRPRAA